MSVLIVGSTALDSIKTPKAENRRLLGGSASHAGVAASFFGPVKLVGVVGDDFPRRYIQLYSATGSTWRACNGCPGRRSIGRGNTRLNMNNRRTLATELGVFETFTPTLPAAYQSTPFVLLANIAPALQSHVLDQMRRPRFVAADTMDLWLKVALPDLLKLLKRLDAFVLNDSEAQQLTGEDNVFGALKKIHRVGPQHVIIKQGSHGSMSVGPARLVHLPGLSVAKGGGPDGRRGFVCGRHDGLPGGSQGAGGRPYPPGDGLRQRGGVVLLRGIRLAAHCENHPRAD